jgi:hypothetical protein
MCLGLRVETAVEVGLVCLEEARPVPWVGIVVLVDAAGSKDGAVDALLKAGVCQVKRSNDIGPHGSLLVVFAPVNVRPACAAGSVQDVGGLDAVQLGQDSLTVLHANGCAGDFLSLLLQECLQVAGNPALTAPDQEAVRRAAAIGTVGSHCDVVNVRSSKCRCSFG